MEGRFVEGVRVCLGRSEPSAALGLMESPFSVFEDGHSLVKRRLEAASEGDNEEEERCVGTLRDFGREGYLQTSGEKDTNGVKWRESRGGMWEGGRQKER